MPDSPDKLSQFWQELKRRKVIKVLAMYAGAAYVLIELANNVVEPLNLPDWTPRLVILLLIVGFPIAAILSWIFDLTPEGIKKTESIEETIEPPPPPLPIKRRLKVSDGIIAVLVVVVMIMAYPKIFQKEQSLASMTFPVTVINEFGEKKTRRVFKENYVTRLAIFPFTNESKDSSENWLQIGIYDAIGVDLLQFNYIIMGFNPDATHLQEQIKFAKTNNFPHFLTGIFRITDGIYEITSRLYQTTNGAVKAERVFKGSDFFSLIDSISLQTRIDLGISKSILNSSSDLPINEQTTNNLDAYRSFTEGWYYRQLKTSSFWAGLNKAIELDSTFADALYYKANSLYVFELSNETARKVINQAMRHRQRLSEFIEIRTRILYYKIRGEKDKAVSLSEMQYELQPNNIQLLRDLASTYLKNLMVQEYEKAALELNELVPDHPNYQILLAKSYLLTGKLDKGLKVLEKLLSTNPDNVRALLRMGQLYLHKNDLEAAEQVFKKAILFQPEDEKYWSKILDHIVYARNNPVGIDFLVPFTGNFTLENGGMTVPFFIHNDHLMSKAKNQFPGHAYPVSDSQVVSYNGLFTQTFLSDNQNKIVKMINEQRNVDTPYTLWKEDSLITRARDLLQHDNQTDALPVFREAYDQNPEHHYLANFIKHLEFIQSQEYEKLKPVLESYVGKYGAKTIFYENDHFFIINQDGIKRKLRPLSEYFFMYGDNYFKQIQIVEEHDSVTGLKFVRKDGSEEFFPRTN